jgi:hypothetical protein
MALTADAFGADPEPPLVVTTADVASLDPATTRLRIDVGPGMLPLLAERCPRIVELRIECDYTIPIHEFRALARLPDLQRLHLSGDLSCYEEHVAALGGLSELRELDLACG